MVHENTLYAWQVTGARVSEYSLLEIVQMMLERAARRVGS
jgi:hypothetical protein